jgi:hypothetical protein
MDTDKRSIIMIAKKKTTVKKTATKKPATRKKDGNWSFFGIKVNGKKKRGSGSRLGICPNCHRKGLRTVTENGRKYKSCKYCDYSRSM